MDRGFGDLALALGMGMEEPRRTIADLLPVADELSPDHVERSLHAHAAGFDVLLGPAAASEGPEPALAGASRGPVPSPPGRPEVPSGLFIGATALLAVSHDAVVLHVPRGFDGLTRAAFELSDHVVLVVGLDLMSLYGARRALADGVGLRRGWDVVVNAARRSQVGDADVERVLGVRPIARIRSDPSVRDAQDRGVLLRTGARGAARDVERLVARVAATLGLAGEAVAG